MTFVRHHDDAIPPPSAGLSARAAFALVACAGLGLVIAMNVVVFAGPPAIWAPSLALALAGAALGGWLLDRHYPHATLGWGNAVTLLRGAMAAALVTPMLQGTSGWAVAAIAGTALALDGADGWLARREGLASAFGARFDMEVDSVLAAILALTALTSGVAGPAIVALGGARYAFLAAGRALPWLRRPLPQRVGRKAVCVAQLGTLIAVHLPIVPDPVAQALTVAVALALGWSFGRDIVWLWRARA